LHLKFSFDENFDVKVLKAQFILGMVDSLSDELTKAMHSTPHENPYTSLYDDLLSSIPHRVTEDLLQPTVDPLNAESILEIRENISYSLLLIPTASIPQNINQYSLWSAPLLTTNGNKSQSIQLTQLVLPLKVEDDTSPSSNTANEKASTSIKGGADMIVSVALRYCLPPVVAQWLPHRLPQLIMQWIHEHLF